MCLWLYSLLALFRVGGGEKYHEILGGINTIVQRDNSFGSKVLKALLIREFGQIHIRWLHVLLLMNIGLNNNIKLSYYYLKFIKKDIKEYLIFNVKEI